MPLHRCLIALSVLFFVIPAGYASTKIVFIGDSLTEGYGVSPELTYPALIEKKLKEGNLKDVQVLNSSISGSTTASAASRLKWHLKDPTQTKSTVLVLALGANDGLRGLNLNQTRKNLSQAIQDAKSAGILVILAGMKIPPNYGKKYTAEFERLFADLAKEHEITLIPFLLQDVGGAPHLNQADGIHPNEKGHARMAETVFPFILKAVNLKAVKK
jgi:acyl-CoA thioesterase-1